MSDVNTQIKIRLPNGESIELEHLNREAEVDPRDKTDWARIDAMTEEEIEANAWSDPDSAPESAEEIAAIWAEHLRQTRQDLTLSQMQFAEKFHIPLGTLRDWERGASVPDASARTLLRVISREPEAVIRALAS